MSERALISILFSGIDDTALLNAAVKSMRKIFPDAKEGRKTLCLHVEGGDGVDDVDILAVSNRLYVVNCRRFGVCTKGFDGAARWTEFLRQFGSWRPIGVEGCLIYYFHGAHYLSPGSLMEMRSFIESHWNERLVWCGWDARYVCPLSITSRFVSVPVEGDFEVGRDVLRERLEGIAEGILAKPGSSDATLSQIRKTALKLQCLPVTTPELLEVVGEAFGRVWGVEAGEWRGDQQKAFRMIRGSILHHLCLEQLILRLWEMRKENGDGNAARGGARNLRVVS